MIARYAGNPDADLPSFVRVGPTGNAGSGFLGPRYERSRLAGWPVAVLQRSHRHSTGPATARRIAEFHGRPVRPAASGHALRVASAVRGARPAVDAGAGGVQHHRGLAGEPRPLRQHRLRSKLFPGAETGRGGGVVRRVGQDNYDSHADNFVCHRRTWMCSIQPGPGCCRICRTAVCWTTPWSCGWARLPDAVHQQPRGPRPLHPCLDDCAGRRRHPWRPSLRSHGPGRPRGAR